MVSYQFFQTLTNATVYNRVYASPTRSNLHNPVCPLVELDSTVGTEPFSCSAGDFGKTNAVEVEPFFVALLWMLEGEY